MVAMQDFEKPPHSIEKFKQITTLFGTWKEGKTYGDVKTYTSWQHGLFWAGRESLHTSPSFEKFKKTLFENHTEHEAEYMDIISSYNPLSSRDSWQSYSVKYRLPFPLKEREFVIWVRAEMISPDEFIVVSCPRLCGSSETRGRYISVETVKQTREGVLWRMATSSDAGGWLPQFLQRPALPATIAKDVKAVLEYMERKTDQSQAPV